MSVLRTFAVHQKEIAVRILATVATDIFPATVSRVCIAALFFEETGFSQIISYFMCPWFRVFDLDDTQASNLLDTCSSCYDFEAGSSIRSVRGKFLLD